jgi:CRP/FNR family transcriptional regulator, cyclic AMP receptor protein
MEPAEIGETLKNCEFFKGLAPNHIAKIAGLCQLQSYDSGDSIFCQGDLGEHIYVIAEGRVILQRAVDLGARKGTVTLDVLASGRALGCWSTLLEEPHKLMSTAICQKPSKLLLLKGSELRNMMLMNKDLGFKLMENFCFLLRGRIQAAYGAMERI